MLQQRRDFLGHQHVERATREVLPDGAQGGRHQSRIAQVTELDGQDLHAAATALEHCIGWRVCSGGLTNTSLFPPPNTARLRRRGYPNVVNRAWDLYLRARTWSIDSSNNTLPSDMAAETARGGFLERTRGARKVMVLDLGFLGDTVHLLPALWMVRQAYPQAELHAAVADHIISLMTCLPWVDRAWGYPRFPKHATLRQNLQMVARLRRERFDVVINLNGSDRSSWLTFLSGAPARLGRRPTDGGPLVLAADVHRGRPIQLADEPVYLQKCRCLEQAGFPFTQAEFHAQIDPAHLQAAGITTADAGTYFHLSPFTTADKRELPPEQLAELISGWKAGFRRNAGCFPARLLSANARKWKRWWRGFSASPGECLRAS